ncbi:MAG TPA: DUF58 domain-containing protein [Candidatus Limnocylindrales bacterium]|nr:DUF58 domain-containing protein [Candidatus Limnocylindrales bacterium]
MTLATAIPRTPARPGPGHAPEALLRALDVTIGRRIRGLVPGEFRAHELGGGTELAQVRPYEPGDDVRRIDWNVTARMLVPHVRVHVPERSLTTWLVLDESPSMAFGTADRRKADVAEGVALALGHLSTRHGNRLGVLTYGARESRRVAAQGGRAGLLSVLAAPVADASLDAGLAAVDRTPVPALRFLAGGATRGGLVALVSDFRGPRGWLPQLAPVAARHGLLAVEIRDPREDELPDVGDLTLVDAETGREVRVETSSRRLRERFAEAAAAERASLAVELRRLGARHIVLSTSGEWLRSLAVQLRTGGRVA